MSLGNGSVSNNVVFLLDIPVCSLPGCKVSREYSSAYMSQTLFEYDRCGNLG